MYGVYSRAITKGRNNPDPNIEDLICVRSNQWCIRTRDSIKCKKLYTGLDRRILTCYNSVLYPGIAKLVSRLVWEQDAAGSNPVTRTTFFRKTAFLGGFSALKVRFLRVIDHITTVFREVKWRLYPWNGRMPKNAKSLTHP